MAASSSPLMTTFTSVQLVLIVLLALLVIAGMVWGARAKHRRKAERAQIDTVELGTSDTSPDADVQPPAIAGAPPPPPAMATTPPPPGEDDAPAKIAQPAAPADQPDAPVSQPAAPAVEPEAVPVRSTAPAPQAAPPAPPAPEAGDDLTTLKGLGPKVAARLRELGVSRFTDLAALSPADADALDAQLGTFAGRLRRDRWVEQARYLATGDRAGFEAEFGRLGG